MSDLAGSTATFVAVNAITRKLNYLVRPRHNIDVLRREVEKLKAERSVVEFLTERACRKGEVIEGDVITWLSRANEKIYESRVFLDEVGHSRRFSPNLPLQYKINRKAAYLTKAIMEIERERKKFDRISCLAPLPIINNEAITSRTPILNEIMELLKDPNINMIGVYGPEGVGKTTLVKEVARKADEEKLFDVVTYVAARNKGLEELKNQIAKSVELKFEGNRLCEIQKQKKTILLILDDVWEILDLTKIGIQFGDQGCKILLISRNKVVLSEMNTQTKIPVNRLSEEETWELFQRVVGDAIPDVTIAKEVSKMSAGIPSAIVTIARELRNKGLNHWKDVLNNLHMVYDNINANLEKSAYIASPKSEDSLDMVTAEKHEVLGQPSNIPDLVPSGSEGTKELVTLTPDKLEELSHPSLPINSGKRENITDEISEGLFDSNENMMDRVEDIASAKFDSFVSQEIIALSRTDQTVDFHTPNVRKLLYKLHSSVESLFGPAISKGAYVRVCDGNLDNVSELVLHLSIVYKNIDDMTFKTMKRFKHLRTLLLFPDYGVPIQKVPRDLFLSLKQLRKLNISRSHLSELPSSIGCLQSLQYIDLSYTLIKELPDSFDTLINLQTLKLRGCLNFVQLPNGMRKLTNLRHLDIDVIRQLKSMPPGLGNLTKLQTLSAFLVGNEEGCKIGELKNATNLTGSFCISGLENVSDLEDAKEAALINKNYISILELRWNDKKIDNSTEEEKIFEHLRPTLRLQELSILYYSGSKLPTWISDPSYECLVDLTLYDFKNCCFLQSLGGLPSLQFLCITKMNELERIDHQFCRNGNDNSQARAFPCLKKLKFEDMPKLQEWSGVQSGDFQFLHNLQVKHCPKLKSLPSLSSFKALRQLDMSYCQSIMSFFDEEDVFLEFLTIKDCPELKKRFDRSDGRDWRKIAKNILIDDEEISAH
ncbi:putative disease resistance RPP13-like protein 1 [Senna tora]|uniref:Putative disease resistance RPP13-like protein 1 n=1 Tax=Senna tora TaxID=362788 RepID=A0A834WLM9_9FABA|nr:putative disease resistance RPP13-like protein 1 [Senna tora]